MKRQKTLLSPGGWTALLLLLLCFLLFTLIEKLPGRDAKTQ